MFLEGQDPLIPGIESLGLEVTYVEEEDAGEIIFAYLHLSA